MDIRIVRILIFPFPTETCVLCTGRAARRGTMMLAGFKHSIESSVEASSPHNIRRAATR
jgi:hypothetical protein